MDVRRVPEYCKNVCGSKTGKVGMNEECVSVSPWCSILILLLFHWGSSMTPLGSIWSGIGR